MPTRMTSIVFLSSLGTCREDSKCELAFWPHKRVFLSPVATSCRATHTAPILWSHRLVMRQAGSSSNISSRCCGAFQHAGCENAPVPCSPVAQVWRADLLVYRIPSSPLSTSSFPPLSCTWWKRRLTVDHEAEGGCGTWWGWRCASPRRDCSRSRAGGAARALVCQWVKRS